MAAGMDSNGSPAQQEFTGGSNGPAEKEGLKIALMIIKRVVDSPLVYPDLNG